MRKYRRILAVILVITMFFIQSDWTGFKTVKAASIRRNVATWEELYNFVTTTRLNNPKTDFLSVTLTADISVSGPVDTIELDQELFIDLHGYSMDVTGITGDSLFDIKEYYLYMDDYSSGTPGSVTVDKTFAIAQENARIYADGGIDISTTSTDPVLVSHAYVQSYSDGSSYLYYGIELNDATLNSEGDNSAKVYLPAGMTADIDTFLYGDDSVFGVIDGSYMIDGMTTADITSGSDAGGAYFGLPSRVISEESFRIIFEVGQFESWLIERGFTELLTDTMDFPLEFQYPVNGEGYEEPEFDWPATLDGKPFQFAAWLIGDGMPVTVEQLLEDRYDRSVQLQGYLGTTAVSGTVMTQTWSDDMTVYYYYPWDAIIGDNDALIWDMFDLSEITDGLWDEWSYYQESDVLEFSVKGANAYSHDIPSTAGNYTMRYSVGNAYVVEYQTVDFTIVGDTLPETTAEVTVSNTYYGQTLQVNVVPDILATETVDSITYEYKLQSAADVDASYNTTVPTAPGDYTVRTTVKVTGYQDIVTTEDFTISYLPNPVLAAGQTPYTISGTQDANGSYIGSATITPMAGYMITTDPTDDTKTGSTVEVTSTTSTLQVSLISQQGATRGAITAPYTVPAITIVPTMAITFTTEDFDNWLIAEGVANTDTLAAQMSFPKTETLTAADTFPTYTWATIPGMVFEFEGWVDKTSGALVNPETVLAAGNDVTLALKGKVTASKTAATELKWHTGKDSADLAAAICTAFGIPAAQAASLEYAAAASDTYSSAVPTAAGDYKVRYAANNLTYVSSFDSYTFTIDEEPNASLEGDEVDVPNLPVNMNPTGTTVTVTNNGNAPISITGVTYSDSFTAAFSHTGVPAFPITVAAAADANTASIGEVALLYGLAMGDYSGTMTVAYEDVYGDTYTLDIPVSGRAMGKTAVNASVILTNNTVYFGQTVPVPTMNVTLDAGDTPTTPVFEYKLMSEGNEAYTAVVPTEPGSYDVRGTMTVPGYETITAVTDLTISYVAAPANGTNGKPYTITGDVTEDGWYIGSATITPVAGYTITKDPAVAGSASISVTETTTGFDIYFVSTAADATAGGMTAPVTVEAINVSAGMVLTFTAAGFDGSASAMGITQSVNDLMAFPRTAVLRTGAAFPTFSWVDMTEASYSFISWVDVNGDEVTPAQILAAGTNQTLQMKASLVQSTTAPTVRWHAGMTVVRSGAAGTAVNLGTLLSLTDAQAATAQFKLSTAADTAYSDTIPTDAGTYTVKYQVNENHYLVGYNTFNFSIAASATMALTATDATVPEITYGEDDTTGVDINLSNTGTNDLTVSSVITTDAAFDEAFTLSDVLTDDFTVTTTGAAAKLANVKLKSGLNVGTYNGTITVSFSNEYGESDTLEIPVVGTVAAKVPVITVTQPDYYVGQISSTLNYPATYEGQTVAVVSIDYKVQGADDTTYRAGAPKTAGNYTVRFTGRINGGQYEDAVATDDFTVSYLTLPAGTNPYSLAGTTGENGWYTSDVVITAPAGYTISTSADGKTPVNNITVSATQEAGTIYLVSTANDGTRDAVTDAIVVEALNIDKDVPVVTGVASGQNYYGDSITVTVADANLASVTLDGTAQTITDNTATLNVPAKNNGSYTLVVSDQAGHSETITFTLNEAWLRDGITGSGTYHLIPRVEYRLAGGNWSVGGDGSTYAGGYSFYVATEGDYTFTLN